MTYVCSVIQITAQFTHLDWVPDVNSSIKNQESRSVDTITYFSQQTGISLAERKHPGVSV